MEKSKINFKQIKNFCDQQISEGLRIDYKKDFQKNVELAKTICAFANTAGGIILIGVEADKKRNIPTDIPGIGIVNGLEEKVNNICLSHILPRIKPEIKLCPFKSTNGTQRAVLFIRINQSYRPPCYVLQTREIVVRVNSENIRADLQTIEDLFERRKNFQEALNFVASGQCNTKLIGTETSVFETVLVSLNFAKDVVSFNKENDVVFHNIANEVMRLPEKTPYPYYLRLESRNHQGQITRVCRIDNNRLIFQKAANVDNNKLEAFESFQFLAMVLRASQKFCAHVGYYGDLTFGLNINNARGLGLSLSRGIRLYDEHNSDWDHILVSRTIHFDDFTNLSHTIQSMFNEFCRYFHLALDIKKIEEIVEVFFMPHLT